jgi:hypothetical protein
MNDELKSPPSELDSAGGQHARRGGSGFAISAAKRRKRRKIEGSIMEDIMQLCDVVRETGFAIHRYHKHGHLKKVYENALAHRLRKLGLDVKQQYPLKVYDEDGTLIERRNLFPLCTTSLTCSQAEKN